MNEQPTHIDLFSGIGGFALSAAWAGFRTVAFCEIDPYCQAVLKARFGAVVADAENDRCSGWPKARGQSHDGCHAPGKHGGNNEIRREPSRPSLHGNIRTLSGRLYTGASLLTGGFPCQPFSVAGKRRGAADDRFLWPEMLRVIDEARPAWVLGENVAGLVKMELDRCLSDLEGIGYACWPLVIPACAVDAKHRRDRVWIVGHADEGRIRRAGAQRNGRHAAQSGEALADADSSNRHGRGGALQMGRKRGKGQAPQDDDASGVEWLPEPDVGRVAHGVSARVDRLKGLGNAIVPQVAYEILRAIRDLI